jgi:hypothetical protein
MYNLMKANCVRCRSVNSIVAQNVHHDFHLSALLWIFPPIRKLPWFTLTALLNCHSSINYSSLHNLWPLKSEKPLFLRACYSRWTCHSIVTMKINMRNVASFIELLSLWTTRSFQTSLLGWTAVASTPQIHTLFYFHLLYSIYFNTFVISVKACMQTTHVKVNGLELSRQLNSMKSSRAISRVMCLYTEEDFIECENLSLCLTKCHAMRTYSLLN